jgi:intraflagellar transport protein 140
MKALLEWWARYAESKRAFDKALEFYKKAEDWLSLVRLHCFQGNIQEATNVAIDSESPAASYHLARHYENEDKVEQ